MGGGDPRFADRVPVGEDVDCTAAGSVIVSAEEKGGMRVLSIGGSSGCRAGIVLALGLAGVPGCSSQRAPAPEKPSTAATIVNVRSVVVTVSEAVAADRQERFAKVDGPSRLTRAIESELTRAGRLDRESGRLLQVQVTRYRLRSGAATFWFGLMAGADLLDVNVTVLEGDKTLEEYTTGAGTTGAFAGLDQVSRFEKLATAVARRVVNNL